MDKCEDSQLCLNGDCILALYCCGDVDGCMAVEHGWIGDYTECHFDLERQEVLRKAIVGEGRLVNVPLETSDGKVIGVAYLYEFLPPGETWSGQMFWQDQGGE